jgi:hypothetical protein
MIGWPLKYKLITINILIRIGNKTKNLIYSVHLVIFQCPEDGIKPKYRQIKISYEILIIIKISKKELLDGYG